MASKPRVLVLGGCGFVGRTYARQSVRACVRAWVRGVRAFVCAWGYVRACVRARAFVRVRTRV